MTRSDFAAEITHLIRNENFLHLNFSKINLCKIILNEQQHVK